MSGQNPSKKGAALKTSLRFPSTPVPSRIALVALAMALGACSLAARPIPAAVSHDASLEAAALRAFPSMKDFTGMTPSGTPLQARIVGGWNVDQNEYTGVATKRYIDIVVAVKEDDGSCSWTKGRFSQQHMGGGSYGELHAEFPLEKGAVDCKGLEGGAAEPSGASASSGETAAFASVAPKSGVDPEKPTETDAEFAAKVETIVESLGDDAVDECKTYIREACKRQTGS